MEILNKFLVLLPGLLVYPFHLNFLYFILFSFPSISFLFFMGFIRNILTPRFGSEPELLLCFRDQFKFYTNYDIPQFVSVLFKSSIGSYTIYNKHMMRT